MWFRNRLIQWLKDIIIHPGFSFVVFVFSLFLLCHTQPISSVLRLLLLMITRWLLKFQTSNADVKTSSRSSFLFLCNYFGKKGNLFQKSPHTSSMIYKTEFHHIFITWPVSWNHHDSLRLIVTLLKHTALWWRVDLKSSQVSRNLEIRKKRMDAFKTSNCVWCIP